VSLHVTLVCHTNIHCNRVYIYTDMLALFAASDFEQPTSSLEDDGDVIQDLTAHLTNTCLQDDSTAKESVFLLSDLSGKSFLSPQDHQALGTLSQAQIDKIAQRISQVVGETFMAGLGMPNHFSVGMLQSQTCSQLLIQVYLLVFFARLRLTLLRFLESIYSYPHPRTIWQRSHFICSK